MKYLLYWLSGLLPCRIISDNGLPYLERYYICTILGVRFYLHRFVGSDPARGLHDHPWAWARSLILSGWYFEETRAGTRTVRWYNKLTGDTFHRVVLPKYDVLVTRGTRADAQLLITEFEQQDQPCWTLFFHSLAYVKPWGFLHNVNDGQVSWKKWLPWNYPQDGRASSAEWWKSAPRGKNDPRRMPE
jgi:hypothetical protein